MTNIDTSQPFTKDDAKQLQQICGKFLYYARAIDDTMMHPLNTVATQVTTGTEKTNKAINHFMNYYASNLAKPDYVAVQKIIYTPNN